MARYRLCIFSKKLREELHVLANESNVKTVPKKTRGI